jgi:predicted phosphodiesterase
MTTYAVISDVHGNADNLEKALKVAEANNADFLIFLGDFLNHGPPSLDFLTIFF